MSPPVLKPPEDVPSIVDRYITLIGRVVANLEEREQESRDEGIGLKRQDVNSIVALGRTVVLLRASESSTHTYLDGKPVREKTTDDLKVLVKRMLDETPETEDADDPDED